jgi:hypothetical protein
MKIKYILTAAAVLGALAAALVWTRSGNAGNTAPGDERTGKAPVEPAALQPVDAVVLTSASGTVHLDKDAQGVWRVRESDGQPVDFSRLARLAGQVTDATVLRKVTESPGRIGRLELGTSRVTFSAGGGPVLDLVLGKALDGGTAFRFGDSGPAYLLDTSLFLDTGAANWVDKTVLDLQAEDVASVELPGDDPAAPLRFTRASATAGWTSDQAPAGSAVDGERLNRWLATLGSLRFTRTVPLDGTEFTDAQPHLQRCVLTTFDGGTCTLSIGRKPEQEEIPAGPVIVQYTLPGGPWADNAAAIAFVVPDYSFTQKPAPADLFMPAP